MQIIAVPRLIIFLDIKSSKAENDFNSVNFPVCNAEIEIPEMKPDKSNFRILRLHKTQAVDMDAHISKRKLPVQLIDEETPLKKVPVIDKTAAKVQKKGINSEK